ncbi:MAG: hypothetical protein WBG15_01690 [Xanthobacteraceae bacterium]
MSFGFLAALLVLLLPPSQGFAQAPPAATPAAPAQGPAAAPQAPPAPTLTLNAAQLKKIDGWIAEQGREITVTPIITEILGLTKDGQVVSCRAFAAAGEGDEVHQIYLLPENKGYLEAHFYKNKLDVYWADKDFALKAAVEGVHGQLPAAISFADAQYGFSFEVAWWAKYADAH